MASFKIDTGVPSFGVLVSVSVSANNACYVTEWIKDPLSFTTHSVE